MTEETKKIEKEISSELDFELELKEGKAVIALDHEGSLGYARVEVGVDAVKLIDKMTDLIPGEWDDALLDGLAEKILSKKTGE